jgi:hypothetical protein
MTGMSGMTGGEHAGHASHDQEGQGDVRSASRAGHLLERTEIDVTKGDTIEISGARVTMGGRRVILAREIRKGDQTWTLRDADGRPRWKMAPS